MRDLPGVEPSLVRALVDALAALDASCDEFADHLDAGGVHEHAFGKLVDASKVRDAYHERLPAMKVNLGEARDVARSFTAEFTVPLPPQREPQE